MQHVISAPEHGQRVVSHRGSGVVILVDHNPPQCSLCRDLCCMKYHLQLAGSGANVTARGCQLHPTLADGETIAADAGAVVVAVQCIRPRASYRLSIRYAASGAEVDGLSRSYVDEHVARAAARTATVLFRSGLTVIQALDLLSLFAPAL